MIGNIREILKFIGDDPDREGLRDTPSRIIRAWDEIFAGYRSDPLEILSTAFQDGKCEEMVILRDIEGFSMCEHHMLPFRYKAHVGYLPSERVVGLSKLARVVECFGRRLQIQERMTAQIADAMVEALSPIGVIVVIEGQHLCMQARGVKKQGSTMVTSAIRGRFQKPEVREEFLRLI